MDKSADEKKLFSDFPPVSTTEWEEKIHKDLKGGDYEKRLVWDTQEGFRVKPYYRKEDLAEIEYLDSTPGSFPFVRGLNSGGNDWIVRQDIHTKDAGEANRIAVDAINRGARSVGFNTKELLAKDQTGLMLDGIDPEVTEIHLFGSRSYPLTVSLFMNELDQRKVNKELVRGSLNFDPLGYLLAHGDFYISEENGFEEAVYLLSQLKNELPGFHVITVNGHRFQDAGSTLVQELAFSLAAGNEYLARLTAARFSPDEIAPRITFSFALGPGYFMEIAKLRAARLLWSGIVEQYKPENPDSCAMHIHCVTARWNKTIYDPYVNMLRTTTEGMSGALGNASSISILPFDIPYEEPTGFAERIALNQQLIFKEESHLDKVADPAAGSYFIENMTNSMAIHAWNLFKEVEEKGGIIECIKTGFIQDAIAASRNRKEKEVTQKKILVLGTNQYPNTTETMQDKVSSKQADEEEKPGKYKKIGHFRAGEAFEELRLATEHSVAKGHKTPAVFLFTMGNVAMLRARAGFTTNFFGCAGYRIIDNPGFKTVDAGVEAALKSEAQVVVICSSDEEYGQIVPQAARKIKEQNPGVIVVVAGYPKEKIEEYRSAGVDDFIHIRSNLLEELKIFQHRLGIL